MMKKLEDLESFSGILWNILCLQKSVQNTSEANLTGIGVGKQALCDAYCRKSFGSLEVNELENVRDCILRLSFYW